MNLVNSNSVQAQAWKKIKESPEKTLQKISRKNRNTPALYKDLIGAISLAIVEMTKALDWGKPKISQHRPSKNKERQIGGVGVKGLLVKTNTSRWNF